MAHRVPEPEGRDGPVRRRSHQHALRITLAGYLIAVLVITQWPTPPDPDGITWLRSALDWLHEAGLPDAVDLTVVEAFANVVMFVPFGVLLPQVARIRPALAVLLGAGFSALIELSQLVFLPDRFPTVRDVVMNTLGAAIGAVCLPATRAFRAERRRKDNAAGHTDGPSSLAPVAPTLKYGHPSERRNLD
jgi:glycopeptide antibiotics resistance protein